MLLFPHGAGLPETGVEAGAADFKSNANRLQGLENDGN